MKQSWRLRYFTDMYVVCTRLPYIYVCMWEASCELGSSDSNDDDGINPKTKRQQQRTHKHALADVKQINAQHRTCATTAAAVVCMYSIMRSHGYIQIIYIYIYIHDTDAME